MVTEITTTEITTGNEPSKTTVTKVGTLDKLTTTNIIAMTVVCIIAYIAVVDAGYRKDIISIGYMVLGFYFGAQSQKASNK